MKVIIIFLIILTQSLYASVVGKVAAKSGNIVLIRNNERIEVFNNMEIQNKDIIKTEKKSVVQIIFVDDAIATIGENSVFNLESYSLDTKDATDFSLMSGTLKFMSGHMSKFSKEKFKLKTKTATMGIRGTQLIVKSDADSDLFVCLLGAIAVKLNQSSNQLEQLVPEGYFIQTSLNGIEQMQKTNFKILQDLNSAFKVRATKSNAVPQTVANLSMYFDEVSIDAAKVSSSYLTDNDSDVSAIFDSLLSKEGMVGAVKYSKISTLTNVNKTDNTHNYQGTTGYTAVLPVADSEYQGYLSFKEPAIEIFPNITDNQEYSSQSAIYSATFIPNDLISFNVGIDVEGLNLPYNALYQNVVDENYLFYDNLKQFYSWQYTNEIDDFVFTQSGFAGKETSKLNLPADQFLVYGSVLDDTLSYSSSAIAVSGKVYDGKQGGLIINTHNGSVIKLKSLEDASVEYSARLHADTNNNMQFVYSYLGYENKNISTQGKLYGDYAQGIGLLNTYYKDTDKNALFSQSISAYRQNFNPQYLPSQPETGTVNFQGFIYGYRQDNHGNYVNPYFKNTIDWEVNKDTGVISGDIICRNNTQNCSLDGGTSAYISTALFNLQGKKDDTSVDVYSKYVKNDEYDAYASSAVYYSIDGKTTDETYMIDNGFIVAGEVTSKNDLDTLVSNSTTYSYAGAVDGNVYISKNSKDGLNMDYIDPRKSTVLVNMDFGSANPISGDININTLGSNDSFAPISMSGKFEPSTSSINTANSGFTSDIAQGNLISNSEITSGSLEGKIFGPTASSIGGGFTIDGVHNNAEIGAIKAFGTFKAAR